MLVAEFEGPVFTPHQRKRLQKAAEMAIENEGCVTSASGITAVYALNYCNLKGYDYQLVCVDRMYSIERLNAVDSPT